MKIGDLVQHIEDGEMGIVLNVIDDICVPPVVEVVWAVGDICKVYEDDVKRIDETGKR